MPMLYGLIVVALAVLTAPAPSAAAEAACPSVLDHQFSNLWDEPASLCHFSGKINNKKPDREISLTRIETLSIC
jgi:hypothetical protein